MVNNFKNEIQNWQNRISNLFIKPCIMISSKSILFLEYSPFQSTKLSLNYRKPRANMNNTNFMNKKNVGNM